MKKLVYILLAIATILPFSLHSQDTIFLNGTNRVNFTLNRSVNTYFVNCNQSYAPASTTIRSLSSVGKFLLKSDGSGYIIPISGYFGTWKIYSKGCGLSETTVVFMTRPTPAPTPSVPFSYSWFGAIGNTSSIDYGPEKIKALRAPTGLCEFNGFMYFTTGFTEGNSPMFKVNLSNITKRIEVSKPINNDFVFEGVDVKSYGDKLYLLGFDPHGYHNNNGYSSKINSGIVVYNTSDQEVSMQYGTSVKCTYQDNPYISVIGLIRDDTSFHPKRLDVDANYLYVYTNNLVVKYNRLTGQFISSNSYTQPNYISSYTRNGITLTMTTSGVTYNGKSLCLPQSSPKVDNYTYSYRDLNNYKVKGGVHIGTDGTFWVIDAGNCRILHYSSTGLYINQIAYISMNYSASVDRNNPTRVFAGPLEYRVTYPGMQWELVNNWFYGLHSNYLPIRYENVSGFLRSVVTVNGETFAIVDSINSDFFKFPCKMKLTSSGLKRVKVYDAFTNLWFDKSGNEYIAICDNQLGSTNILYKNGIQVEQSPVITTTSASYMDDDGFVVTDSGYYVIFNGHKNATANYHLEWVKNGQVLSKRALSITSSTYPTTDRFLIYSGGGMPAASSVHTDGNIVVFMYTGEGFNGAQVTKLHIFKGRNYLTTIGKTYAEASAIDGLETPREYAGNAREGNLVEVNGVYYYFFNDEHGGALQVFKLNGLK